MAFVTSKKHTGKGMKEQRNEGKKEGQERGKESRKKQESKERKGKKGKRKTDEIYLYHSSPGSISLSMANLGDQIG